MTHPAAEPRNGAAYPQGEKAPPPIVKRTLRPVKVHRLLIRSLDRSCGGEPELQRRHRRSARHEAARVE
eukprot:6117424-Amphidinium_carterae.2